MRALLSSARFPYLDLSKPTCKNHQNTWSPCSNLLEPTARRSTYRSSTCGRSAGCRRNCRLRRSYPAPVSPPAPVPVPAPSSGCARTSRDDLLNFVARICRANQRIYLSWLSLVASRRSTSTSANRAATRLRRPRKTRHWCPSTGSSRAASN